MEKIKYIIGNKEHAQEIQQYFAKFDKSVADYYNFEYDNFAYFVNPDTGCVDCFNTTDDWEYKAFVEASVFEELKYPYGAKPKLQVIRGDYNRGSEIIGLLESLGGNNQRGLKGDEGLWYYFIDPEKTINYSMYESKFFDDFELEVLSLPKKEESKPKLKVIQGDRNRGREVIELLKGLGGIETFCSQGDDFESYYYIDNYKTIRRHYIYDSFFKSFELEIMTLPEKVVSKPKLKVISGVTGRGDEVIELLVSLGGINDGLWIGNGDEGYYFIDDDRHIKYDDFDSKYFNKFELEILNLPEKSEIARAYTEFPFKPFETKVLVRRDKFALWLPAIYFERCSDGNYHIVGSFDTFKECIQYEGNEHLVFTSINQEGI